MKAIYKSIKKSGKSIFETKEKEAAALSNTGVNDGFVLAVKEATIGSSLPLDLRTWKPHHVDEWLCDTFSGAQSLSK